VREAPRFVAVLTFANRQDREGPPILQRLAQGEADISTLVRGIYVGLDPRLVKAGGLGRFLANLEDLVARELVTTEGPKAVERGPLPLGMTFTFWAGLSWPVDFFRRLLCRRRPLRLLGAGSRLRYRSSGPRTRAAIGAEIERAV